jgi:hypothetical protein
VVLPTADLEPGLRAAGEDAARRALDAGECVADLTALGVLGLLSCRGEVTSALPGLAVTPSAARDINLTLDHLRSAIAGLAGGPGTAQANDFLGKLLRQAGTLEELADELDIRYPAPRTDLPADDAISCARACSLPLWCDDSGLRQRARRAGVPAFIILDLLTVLRKRPGALPGGDIAEQELAAGYVVDLPLPAEIIITIAGNWDPGLAHAVVSRPAWCASHADDWPAQWRRIAAAAARTESESALTGIVQAGLAGGPGT